jgi:hypothetical protein
VLLAGHLRVLHGKGGSSRHRPVFVSRHKHRGMWRWFREFDPAARNPLTRMAVWCGIWLHFALTAPLLAMRRGSGRRFNNPFSRLREKVPEGRMRVSRAKRASIRGRVTGLQNPSMDFALWADLRSFKFVPDEFVRPSPG